jgi:transposase-like protein
MAKTQSQTGNTAIKKEEQDSKTTLLLNGVNNTRRSSRIAKRTPPIINNRRLPNQQVKVEEDTDIKPLLQSESSSSNSVPKPRISQEQINQLVHYIVNDNMSVNKAARKVNMCRQSASSYYSLYKNDPEKKTPVARNRCRQPRKNYTQEQIGNLIRYINDDKMTVTEASVKANMAYHSAYHYYNKYLKDPNHNIPIPRLTRNYTQDQKNEFFNYIINDKMNIKAASKKAKMYHGTAKAYYRKYFKFQNPDIARPSHIATRKYYTQEQKKELISYIVDDKMSIKAASKKLNIPRPTGHQYYHQHLKDHHIDYPIQKSITEEQKSKLIGYIINNTMSVRAASKKANISYTSGHRHYHLYLKDQRRDART